MIYPFLSVQEESTEGVKYCSNKHCLTEDCALWVDYKCSCESEKCNHNFKGCGLIRRD